MRNRYVIAMALLVTTALVGGVAARPQAHTADDGVVDD